MADLYRRGKPLVPHQRSITPVINAELAAIEAAFGSAQTQFDEVAQAIKQVKVVANNSASKDDLEGVVAIVPTAQQIASQIDAQVAEITNRVGSLESWQEEGVEATKILGKIQASQVQIKVLDELGGLKLSALNIPVLDELGGLVGESVDWANLAPGVASRITSVENGNELLTQKIETIVAASTGDMEQVLAAIQTEQTARIAADNAEALSRTQLAAEVAGNKSSADQSIAALNTAAQAEAQARLALASTVADNKANADTRLNTLATTTDAQAQLLTGLRSDVDGNAASATTRMNTLATADTALGQRIDTLTTTVGANKSSADTSIATLTTNLTAETQARTALASTVADNKANADTRLNTLTTAKDAQAQLLTGLRSDVDGNAASATTRMNTLANDVQAVGQSVTTLGAKVDGNKATYDATVQTLAEKDQSLTTQLNTISATVTGNKTTTDAAISSANQARADGDAANAASIATVAARMNTGGDIAAAITAAATAASQAQTTADGKASAASVSVLQATADAKSQMVFVPGDHSRFYPVKVSLRAHELPGADASGALFDFVVRRGAVHQDETWLSSYAARVVAQASSWGNTPGRVFEVSQTTGGGSYRWGLGNVDAMMGDTSVVIWLRGGMSHTVFVDQPTTGVFFTLPSGDGTLTDPMRGVLLSIAEADAACGWHLDETWCPDANIGTDSVKGLPQLVSDVSATINRVSQVETNVAGKASASEVAVISAKVDSNAASITTISAVAIDAQNKVNAKLGAVLDVNGKLSGFQSTNNGTISNFVITSDKVLISADEMIVDGSLTAKKFNAAELKAAIGSFGSLSALSANLGEVQAGLIRSTDWSSYVDLTGEQDYFIYSPSFEIGHDGCAWARQMTLYEGYLRNVSNSSFLNLNIGGSSAATALQLGGGAFRVLGNGAVYANNAYIRGDVHATSISAQTVTTSSVTPGTIHSIGYAKQSYGTHCAYVAMSPYTHDSFTFGDESSELVSAGAGATRKLNPYQITIDYRQSFTSYLRLVQVYFYGTPTTATLNAIAVHYYNTGNTAYLSGSGYSATLLLNRMMSGAPSFCYSTTVVPTYSRLDARPQYVGFIALSTNTNNYDMYLNVMEVRK